MTQIQCPQCHGEIADCPHCGFPLGQMTEQEEMEKQQSPLGEPIRNMPFGITFIVVGVLGLVGSLFVIINTLFGLIFFALSAIIMVVGITMIIGHITAECPFCNQKIHVAPYAQNITCQHCKTISVRKDNYLELL